MTIGHLRLGENPGIVPGRLVVYRIHFETDSQSDRRHRNMPFHLTLSTVLTADLFLVEAIQ